MTYRLASLVTGLLLSTVSLANTGNAGEAASPSASQAIEQPVRQSMAKPVGKTVTLPFASLGRDTVAAYLAREWALGQAYAKQVASGILTSSKRHGVDPLLLMAVAATESSFKHWVGNPDGGKDPMKPFGIMQVAGRYHADKFPGRAVKPTTLKENIDIGAQVLKDCLASTGGDERRALLRYNGSSANNHKYLMKVSQLKHSLFLGLQGQRRFEMG